MNTTAYGLLMVNFEGCCLVDEWIFFPGRACSWHVRSRTVNLMATIPSLYRVYLLKESLVLCSLLIHAHIWPSKNYSQRNPTQFCEINDEVHGCLLGVCNYVRESKISSGFKVKQSPVKGAKVSRSSTSNCPLMQKLCR